MFRVLRHILAGVVAGAALCACSLVDDDLSQCNTAYTLDYQLRLVTNITTELETELSMEFDAEVRSVLQGYLENIFTDYARDVDLSFYDRGTPMPRLQHRTEQMNGSESSYALTLPVQAYRHLAVANIAASTNVKLENDGECLTSTLTQQADGNVVRPHSIGLFTARKDMDVMYGVDQHFDVRLYMANAASALVLDMSGAPEIKGLRVMLDGFADGFRISDSTYVFSSPVDVGTDMLETADKRTRCYASVHFPSPEPAETKVVIQVDSDEDRSSTPLWHWRAYVELADGSVTESVISMYTPLRAGHIEILRGRVAENGAVVLSDEKTAVGVSVTLNWENGVEFPVYF